jgi:manganese/zinc/iron transport system permease protein
MLNPYWGNTFFEFFLTLAKRILLFLQGQTFELFADELQILVLVLISLSCATVGLFLVLRKMTMLANALSHTILVGIIGAFWIHQFLVPQESCSNFIEVLPNDSLLIASGFVMAALTTFLTESCIRFFSVAEDAATAIVFAFLFALGILLVTCTSKDSHIGIELVMGNVDALHRGDLRLVFWVFVITACSFLFFWRFICVATFDPVFSGLCGISSQKVSYLLMVLTAVCSIGAFRAVGVLMVLALFVTPVLIARLFCDRLSSLLVVSASFACMISVIGVALTRHLLSVYDIAASTSGVIVALLFLFYCLSLIAKYVRFRHNYPFPKKDIVL